MTTYLDPDAGTAREPATMAELGDFAANVPQAAEADLAAITGGDAPTEAEHNAVRTKINAILAKLRTAGIIAAS